MTLGKIQYTGSAGDRDVPLVLGQEPHLVDVAPAQDHAVQVRVLVVQLHVAVEAVRQRVAVQHREVVRLAEGVHGELPVAGGVVGVAGERPHPVEVPGRELVVEPVAEQVVEVDRGVGVGVHEQQPVALLGGEWAQAEARPVDVAEVFGLRETDQRAAGVVGPRVERAGESAFGAALLGLDHRAAVAARVDERPELAVLVAGREDRDAEVVVGQERAGLGEVERQPDALRCTAEELDALALGENRVRVVGRRQPPQSAGVDGRAGVEVGAQLLDQSDLLVVAHF